MLFDYIEKDNKHWYEIILSNYDFNIHSGFSEYETYGHFLKNYYQDFFIIRKLYWINLKGVPNDFFLYLLKKKYDFVSFHSYNRKQNIKTFLSNIKNIIKL